MNLKKIKIISIFGVFIISIMSHFMYKLFPNIIFSFIFPVNESIWEHMKIIFTSYLIYSIIEYLLLKKYNIKYNNFNLNLYIVPLFEIALYLAIYIPLYNIIGEKLIISISLLFIVYSIGAYISYKLLQEKNYKILNSISVLITLLVYILFIYLTYNPPHNYIFYDNKNKKYSIDNYTIS